MGFINAIRIASCDDAHKQQAVNELYSRSLLYNRSDKSLGIVVEDNNKKDYVSLSANPDNKNIQKINDKLSLADNIYVQSITAEGIANWSSQRLLFETDKNHTICLLFKINLDNQLNKILAGDIIQIGDNVSSHYRLSVTTTGEKLLTGITTLDESVEIIVVRFRSNYYYALKFDQTPSKIYFVGWDNIPLTYKNLFQYNDDDLTIINNPNLLKKITTFDLLYNTFLQNIMFSNFIKFSENGFIGVKSRDQKLVLYTIIQYKNIKITRQLQQYKGYLSLAKGLTGKILLNKKGTVTFDVFNSKNLQITISKINDDKTVGETIEIINPKNSNETVKLTTNELKKGEYYFSVNNNTTYRSITFLE